MPTFTAHVAGSCQSKNLKLRDDDDDDNDDDDDDIMMIIIIFIETC